MQLPPDPIMNLSFSCSLHVQTCPQGKEKTLSAFIRVHLRPKLFFFQFADHLPQADLAIGKALQDCLILSVHQSIT